MKPKATIIFLLLILIFTTTCEKPERTNPWDEKANAESWVPQNLQIEGVSITEKKLTWTYTDKNIEGFKIDRKKGDEPWQVAYQTLPKETRSWNDTEIIPDPLITYAYRLYAYAGSNSSSELTVSASASAAIVAPTNLEITNNTIRSITLTWQDYSTDEDGYKIERKYGDGSWDTLATVKSNNFVDNSFRLNTQVYYRICAYYGSYITPWAETNFDATIPPPENLQIKVNSATSLILTWSYSHAGHEGFKIELEIDNGGWEILEVNLNPNQNSITYGGLDLPKHDYRYRVYAFYGAFQSDYAEGLAHYVLSIGEIYKGGIVFYLDGNGGGLVCAESDQNAIVHWGCYGTTIGGTGTSIGTGAANTTSITAGCSETDFAARLCHDLVLNGYSDWFLPSKDELNLMYQNLKPAGIGGLAEGTYWSSSEVSSYHTWLQNFYSGSQHSYDKSTNFRVRAVRAF